MPDEILNKVANSGLITIDLTDFLPKEIAELDIKDFLFMQMLLKEKDFREKLKELNWKAFDSKDVAVFCSSDAIVPAWAYMLIGSYLQPVANSIIYGTKQLAEEKLLLNSIASLDTTHYKNQRVIIKGCGDKAIPDSAYLEITRVLRPVTKSIMYGEACSNVPIYKSQS